MCFRDRPGAKFKDDCLKCPRGTFGDREGIVASECSGKCSSLDTPKTKYYGDEIGEDELTLVCNNLDQVMENRAGDLWREYQARRKKRLERRYSDDSDRVRHLI
jgi:hypothetical protein